MASLMSFYGMFLLYNGLSSEEDEKCNPYYKSDVGSMWLGILFTLISLCYSAMKADLLGSAVDMSGVSCFGCCPGYAHGSIVADGVKKDLKGLDNEMNKESLILDSMSNYNDNGSSSSVAPATGDDAGTVIHLESSQSKSGLFFVFVCVFVLVFDCL